MADSLMHLGDLAEMPKKTQNYKDEILKSLYRFATEGTAEPSIYDIRSIYCAGNFFASYYRGNNPEECEKWQLIAIEWSERCETLEAIQKAEREQVKIKHRHESLSYTKRAADAVVRKAQEAIIALQEVLKNATDASNSARSGMESKDFSTVEKLYTECNNDWYKTGPSIKSAVVKFRDLKEGF